MPEITRQTFDMPEETRPFSPPESGQVDLVGGGQIGRGTFMPGWRWALNVKPIAGTDLCQQAHTGYVQQGRMTILMEDGYQVTLDPGDYVSIPPGHDAWVVGDEPCIIIDWQGFADYAQAAAAADSGAATSGISVQQVPPITPPAP